MVNDGAVFCDAADKHNRLKGKRSRKEDVDDVPCEARAETVADLCQGEALLLGVDKVGFGEDGASGGDLGKSTPVFEGECCKGFDTGQVQAPCLLVEEAPRTGGAGGVCFAVEIIPVLVEGDEAETLAPHTENGARLSMEAVHCLHSAEAIIVPAIGCNERGGGGGGSHGIDSGKVESADDVPKRVGDRPVMKHPGGPKDFSACIDFRNVNGNGTDVDAEEMRCAVHDSFPSHRRSCGRVAHTAPRAWHTVQFRIGPICRPVKLDEPLRKPGSRVLVTI